jgi:hypothetical protein
MNRREAFNRVDHHDSVTNDRRQMPRREESRKVLWEKDQILKACRMLGEGPVLIGVAAEVLRGFRATSPVIQFAIRDVGAIRWSTQGTLRLGNDVLLDYQILEFTEADSKELDHASPGAMIYGYSALEAIGLDELWSSPGRDDVRLASMEWNADFMGIFQSPYTDKIAKIVAAADHAYKNNFIEERDFLLFGDIITFNELPSEAQKPLIHSTLLHRIEASESSIFLKALLGDKDHHESSSNQADTNL